MSNSLWIGDVGPHWSEAVFGPFLAQLPGFVAVKLMTRTGYGFIDFASNEAAAHAMNMLNNSNNPVYGGTFRMKWAGEKNQVQLGGGATAPGEWSTFVGGLVPEADEAAVLQLFQSRYASVTGARVVRDHENKSKGFCFVRFSSQEEMRKSIVECNGALIGGQPIRVSEANAKGMPPPPREDRGPRERRDRDFDRGGDRGDRGGYGPPPGPPRVQITLPFAPPPTEEEGNTTVFVGGIAPEVTELDVFQAFCAIGPVSSISVPRGRGCAFVQYQYRAHCEAAIRSMNGLTMHGSILRCTFGKAQMRSGVKEPVPAAPNAALVLGTGVAVAASTGMPIQQGMPGGPMGMGMGMAGGMYPAGAAGAGAQPFGNEAAALPGLGAGASAGAGASSSAASGQAGKDDVDMSSRVPEDIAAAFVHASVADSGDLMTAWDPRAANRAFGLRSVALMGHAGPALTLSAMSFAAAAQGQEDGTIIPVSMRTRT